MWANQWACLCDSATERISPFLGVFFRRVVAIQHSMHFHAISWNLLEQVQSEHEMT